MAGGMTVTMNSGAQLVWGTTPSFNPANIYLGDQPNTTSTLFTNAIDLNSATARTIFNNSTTNTLAAAGTFSGVISNSNGAPGGLTKDGTAWIVLSNTANSFGGPLSVINGTLQVAAFGNTTNGSGTVVLGGSANTGVLVYNAAAGTAAVQTTRGIQIGSVAAALAVAQSITPAPTR